MTALTGLILFMKITDFTKPNKNSQLIKYHK